MTTSTLDPEVADLRRQLRRLDRRLADLDRGSRVQLANHVDALLDRLEDDAPPSFEVF